MAKQVGDKKITGIFGGMQFYYDKRWGYLVRSVGRVSRKRRKYDPKFEATRSNAAEFGRAGRASGTLRKALRSLLEHATGGSCHYRLTSELCRVVRLGTQNARGQRILQQENLDRLSEFCFNESMPLASVLKVSYQTRIKETSEGKQFVIRFLPFSPSEGIQPPEGTTHAKIVSAAGRVDFKIKNAKLHTETSGLLDLSSKRMISIELSHTVADGTDLSCGFLGVQFFREENGKIIMMNGDKFVSLGYIPLVENVEQPDYEGHDAEKRLGCSPNECHDCLNYDFSDFCDYLNQWAYRAGPT